MKLTVLFDLDDTLLNTNTGEFLPAYFNGLGQALSHLGSQEKITEQIRVAVDQMIANQDPSKLLKEVFAENFYSALGTTETECQDFLEKFYASEYPKFQSLIDPKPEVRSLVQWCKSQKLRMAIATNPLFPETATLQRIKWAGLKPKDFQFFSTYENFHFAKPNLRYYAEAIGRLGWPEEPIVMVGDNLTHDILPVEEMGLDTFWVDSVVKETKRPQGSLSDVKHFLVNLQNTNCENSLAENPEVLIAVLRSTPAVLNSWLEIYDRDVLHQKPSKNEWSVNEIFWHLSDFEERVYLPQWRQLLQNPDQSVPHIEINHWSKEENYASRDLNHAYQRFLKCRLDSLELIEALLEKGFFEINIQHMVFSEAKISELVGFAARHDRLHLRQCAGVLQI